MTGIAEGITITGPLAYAISFACLLVSFGFIFWLFYDRLKSKKRKPRK